MGPLIQRKFWLLSKVTGLVKLTQNRTTSKLQCVFPSLRGGILLSDTFILSGEIIDFARP